jgi:hypothetical protein
MIAVYTKEVGKKIDTTFLDFGLYHLAPLEIKYKGQFYWRTSPDNEATCNGQHHPFALIHTEYEISRIQ